MSRAASFAERWARDNLTREATKDELTVLDLFPLTCEGDETEACKRARRYYTARSPGGLADLWHNRHPDDEDILSSCQDAYVVPLKARSVGGRRMTLVRLPAPTALDRPLSARALLSRWLMILDIRKDAPIALRQIRYTHGSQRGKFVPRGGDPDVRGALRPRWIRLRDDPTPGEEVVFIDVSDLQPSHLKNHFRGTYWKHFVWCMKQAYPLRFSEVHIINTQRLKTMSLLLLHIGLYPWRRNVVQVHANDEQINHAMGVDYFPVDGLPYEYGGKAGAMKDLNDEWTKKLLSNSKWLQTEERKFYDTVLKPEGRIRTRHRSAVRNLRGRNASYNMLTRTLSCKSLHRHDDLDILVDENLYGAYRTLRISDLGSYL